MGIAKEMVAMNAIAETIPNIEPAPSNDWVDAHAGYLFNFAIGQVRDAHVAEDLVQETFLAAVKSRGRFCGQSSERTWLVGILRHKLLDHDRRSSRERRCDEREISYDDVLERCFERRGRWKVTPARWRENPTSDLERREFWMALTQCLRVLPPGLSDAFLLRELDGLESDIICENLQISPANLWQRLHRSRMLLRECLERLGFGEGPSLPRKGQPCAGCRGSGTS